jgi:hypothetical protein
LTDALTAWAWQHVFASKIIYLRNRQLFWDSALGYCNLFMFFSLHGAKKKKWLSQRTHSLSSAHALSASPMSQTRTHVLYYITRSSWHVLYVLQVLTSTCASSSRRWTQPESRESPASCRCSRSGVDRSRMTMHANWYDPETHGGCRRRASGLRPYPACDHCGQAFPCRTICARRVQEIRASRGREPGNRRTSRIDEDHAARRTSTTPSPASPAWATVAHRRGTCA